MQKKVDFEYRDLIKEPLSKTELQGLAEITGTTLPGLINSRSTVFKKLKISPAEVSEEKAATLIAENPRILTRPILVRGKKAVLGFKEEAFMQFLGLNLTKG